MSIETVNHTTETTRTSALDKIKGFVTEVFRGSRELISTTTAAAKQNPLEGANIGIGENAPRINGVPWDKTSPASTDEALLIKHLEEAVAHYAVDSKTVEKDIDALEKVMRQKTAVVGQIRSVGASESQDAEKEHVTGLRNDNPARAAVEASRSRGMTAPVA